MTTKTGRVGGETPKQDAKNPLSAASTAEGSGSKASSSPAQDAVPTTPVQIPGAISGGGTPAGSPTAGPGAGVPETREEPVTDPSSRSSREVTTDAFVKGLVDRLSDEFVAEGDGGSGQAKVVGAVVSSSSEDLVNSNDAADGLAKGKEGAANAKETAEAKDPVVEVVDASRDAKSSVEKYAADDSDSKDGVAKSSAADAGDAGGAADTAAAAEDAAVVKPLAPVAAAVVAGPAAEAAASSETPEDKSATAQGAPETSETKKSEEAAVSEDRKEASKTPAAASQSVVETTGPTSPVFLHAVPGGVGELEELQGRYETYISRCGCVAFLLF